MTVDSTQLNEFLSTRSYLVGYLPSTADVELLKLVASGPDAKKFPHLARWYTHISSFSDAEQKSFPATTLPAGVTTGGAAASNGSAAAAKKDDDDDFDLFGSDDEEEDAEAAAEREKRLADYAAKKAKKPGPIAKSSIVLDVKPWGDDTDMVEMEKLVREITSDGLLWGASKLVAIGYGIKKLQISCVVEDDKVGTDFLEEKITELEDLVQSVDVAAFQKI